MLVLLLGAAPGVMLLTLLVLTSLLPQVPTFRATEDGWSEYATKSAPGMQDFYYHNQTTKQTQWRDPSLPLPLPAPVQAPVQQPQQAQQPQAGSSSVPAVLLEGRSSAVQVVAVAVQATAAAGISVAAHKLMQVVTPSGKVGVSWRSE